MLSDSRGNLNLMFLMCVLFIGFYQWRLVGGRGGEANDGRLADVVTLVGREAKPVQRLHIV